MIDIIWGPAGAALSLQAASLTAFLQRHHRAITGIFGPSTHPNHGADTMAATPDTTALSLVRNPPAPPLKKGDF
ncbi:MAG: hypothetical protein AAGA85_02145 [Bacteroidota bacterium]